MRNDKPNLIVNLTFEFSIKVIQFAETLNKQDKKVVPNQLLKSGTSIGANTLVRRMDTLSNHQIN